MKKSDSTDNLMIKDSLARIRDIQEEIMLEIHKRKPLFLPKENSHNDNGEISFTKCNYFLKKNSEYPEYIHLPALATYKVACSYGIHTAGKSIENKQPNKYTVKHSLYTLFDFINWYKSIIY